jgi:hypothetical protein
VGEEILNCYGLRGQGNLVGVKATARMLGLSKDSVNLVKEGVRKLIIFLWLKIAFYG